VPTDNPSEWVQVIHCTPLRRSYLSACLLHPPYAGIDIVQRMVAVTPSKSKTRGKRPSDIEVAVRRIREAVEAFPKAALFELAAEKSDSPFEQLVACIISIRTRDEVTLPTAQRLFKTARTAEQMAGLSLEEIEGHIRERTFHEPKTRLIHEIARRVVDEYGGRCSTCVDRSA
jgi:endonuclease III